MAACQDIITRALRKLNVFPIGSALDPLQAANAMTVLQSVYVELLGWGAFGRENDILASGDWVAMPNSRVRVVDPDATVSVPDQIAPWSYPGWWDPSWDYDAWPIWPASCAGSGNYAPASPASGIVTPGAVVPTCTCCCEAPPDLSVVTVVDPTNNAARTFIYDAYVGSWQPLDGLLLTTEAPLSRRWAEPLANVLAARLATEYGSTVTPAMEIAVRNGLQAMTMRYGSARTPVRVAYC